MKRVLTVQDISCIGRCSLTVALPIISSMGIETAVIPTAVLSNHTAFKNGYTYLDMTDNITAILKQWEKEKFRFDTVYTGYIGSAEGICIIRDLLGSSAIKESLKIADPAMADNGKLYHGLDEEYAEKMKELCKKADVIVPNISEACIMTGREYKNVYSKEEIKDLVEELSDLGPSTVVLTSVKISEDTLGVVVFEKNSDKWFEISYEHLKGVFHGTGDVFASCLCGALTKGIAVDKAVKLSADYVFDSLKRTTEDQSSVWYGISFEDKLSDLSVVVNNILKGTA